MLQGNLDAENSSGDSVSRMPSGGQRQGEKCRGTGHQDGRTHRPVLPRRPQCKKLHTDDFRIS